MYKKLLIAERGEAVMRIARTCERIGIATVAIHDASEAGTPYVLACDEAVCVETTESGEFEAASIVAAARQSAADAVHPGCGARRLDARLATLVGEAGLAWVGSAADAIERFTAREGSRELARLAGVRALAESGLDQTTSATQLAQDIGFPLWVIDDHLGEPVLVESEDDLNAAVAVVCASHPDARVCLRRWLERPRLLTVQVAGDGRDAVALGDAEHSLHWQGRTLIVESPTPALGGATGELKRSALRDAAVRVAREASLIGLATVEFLLDIEGQLYFAQLVPGLSQDHALAELCTGLDLVELQLRLAAGESLPVEARRVQTTGHAVEARIYADDPLSGAISQPQEVSGLRWPILPPGSLRIESELALGTRAAVDREPLLAKVSAYGRTRHQAVLTLDRVLAEAVLEPITTNLNCLREILIDESYRAGHYDVAFVERLLSEVRSRT
jgi:acetyl-CoA carboxylase biotin carboxylase subunit/3-methylcrotonyl-CoA carboxylase alpha subunit